LLLGRVVSRLVSFGLGQDAEERGIAVRYPMAKGKTTNENGNAREYGIEEIESPHGPDADEVEQRAFHAQVGERLMQALEDSICAVLLLWSVGHTTLSSVTD